MRASLPPMFSGAASAIPGAKISLLGADHYGDIASVLSNRTLNRNPVHQCFTAGTWLGTM